MLYFFCFVRISATNDVTRIVLVDLHHLLTFNQIGCKQEFSILAPSAIAAFVFLSEYSEMFIFVFLNPIPIFPHIENPLVRFVDNLHPIDIIWFFIFNTFDKGIINKDDRIGKRQSYLKNNPTLFDGENTISSDIPVLQKFAAPVILCFNVVLPILICNLHFGISNTNLGPK